MLLPYIHRLRRSATILRRLPPPHQPLTTSLSRSFCTLFQESDKNHWLIIVDYPQDYKPSQKELVTSYELTASKIFGSLEMAKQKIYACSTTDYIGFQVECSEETSAKFKDLEEVLLVVPDSYIDPVKKEYGGDMYIDGHIISKPLPPGYLLVGKDDEHCSSNKACMEAENRYNYPLQNFNMPDYSTPHYPLKQYDFPVENFRTPPPANSNMEWANYSKPATPQQNLTTPSPAYGSPSPPPQQNCGPSHPHHQQYGHPRQDFIMSSPAQPNMEGVYTNYSPPVTPQQNFSTPYQAQWRASPPLPQQNFGPSQPQQNYGPSHPAQYQYDPPQQNYGMPPSAQPNMEGVYTDYSLPVTPQQNFSTPSSAQWSPSSPHQNYGPPNPPLQNFNTPSQQQNFGPSPPHQNYGPPHLPQQQYGPPSNFSQHQSYGPSPPQNFGQPGLGDN